MLEFDFHQRFGVFRSGHRRRAGNVAGGPYSGLPASRLHLTMSVRVVGALGAERWGEPLHAARDQISEGRSGFARERR